MKHLTPAILAGCLVLSTVSVTARADGTDAYGTDSNGKPPVYGALMGSYVLPDSIREPTTGVGGIAILGFPLTEHFSIEANIFSTALLNAHSGDTFRVGGAVANTRDSEADTQIGGGADLAYRFGKFDHGIFQPFVLGGIGAEWETYLGSRAQYHWGPYADVGVGILTRLSHHFSLRTEVRYYGIYNDDSYQPHGIGDMHVNVGIQYAFFADPVPPPPPVQCCAPAPIPVPPPKPKCPPAAPGFKVDADGCIIEQNVVIRGINFVFNKDQLTPAARDTLDQVATSLSSRPDLYVEIAGYTDSIGSDAYNVRLSKLRAESVRSYMIQKGFKADHLTAKGMGKANPIASNATPEGRATNRRVEFTVLNKPAAVNVIEKESTPASKAEANKGEPAALSGEKAAPAAGEKAAPAKKKAKVKKAAPAPKAEAPAAAPAAAPAKAN